MKISEIISINLVKPKHKRRARVPSTPIPDQIKREPVVQWLTKKITRQSNVPHVTRDEIALAKKRYQQNQKRVDLAYQKAQRSQAR